jgi:hypothetical protein
MRLVEETYRADQSATYIVRAQPNRPGDVPFRRHPRGVHYPPKPKMDGVAPFERSAQLFAAGRMRFQQQQPRKERVRRRRYGRGPAGNRFDPYQELNHSGR